MTTMPVFWGSPVPDSNENEKKLMESVKNATENEIIECQEVVKKDIVAAMFLHGSDKFW